MIYIFSSIAVVSITMLIIAKFMMWLAERTTHRAVTQKFKDAEFILNHHEAPASWQGTAASKPKLIKRLDKLIDFFETCPFFQDEDTRENMLDQLWLEREQWEEDIRMAVSSS